MSSLFSVRLMVGKADGLLRPYLNKLDKPPVWTCGAGRACCTTTGSPVITMTEAQQELGAGLQG